MAKRRENDSRNAQDGLLASPANVRLGTLADEEAVQRWVAEHRGKLTEAVRKGPVIVR